MNSIKESLLIQLSQLIGPINDSLSLWDIPRDAEVSLLNVSENFHIFSKRFKKF